MVMALPVAHDMPRKWKRGDNLSALSALMLAGLAATLVLSEMRRPVRVVDGDSVALAGMGVVRLEGLDTPELHGKCADERARAQAAAERLGELLRERPVVVAWPAARREKFGRPLVRITAGGRDVAETLISEGLGRTYQGGPRAAWCP